MGDISTSPVSSKSPRQMFSTRCLRTAGVGSTGVSASKFIASSVASVASRCVASRCVASGELRPRELRPGALSRGVGVVEFLAGGVAHRSAPSGQGVLRPVASRCVASRPVAFSPVAFSPVAFLGRLLRRSSPSIGSSSMRPRRVEGLAHGVEFRSSRSSERPRHVLGTAFEKSAELARRVVASCLTGRFGSHSVTSIGSLHAEFQAERTCRVPRCGEIAIPTVSVWSRCVSPAKPWRLH